MAIEAQIILALLTGSALLAVAVDAARPKPVLLKLLSRLTRP